MSWRKARRSSTSRRGPSICRKNSQSWRCNGGVGAWEIAARYSEMDISSKSIAGGKERNVTIGLNWWLNRSLMLRLNYVYANPDPTSAVTLDGVNERIDIIEGRAQVVF